MPEPITILISGAPGTGKSTIRAHAPYFFRARLGETAALSIDEFYRVFDPDWTTNNRDWWKMAVHSCLTVATFLLQHGVQVVAIEGNGLYTQDAVNEVLRTICPLSTIYHVTLDARLDVVTERVRQRGDLAAHPPEWLAAWLDHIRSHYADWTHVIDTSALTPEGTLERIYQYIREGRGITSASVS